MRKKWRLLFACASLFGAVTPSLADIYSFVDENGKSHFSDVRLDDRYQLYMKSPRPPVSAPIVDVAAVTPVKQPELQEPPALNWVPVKAQRKYSPLITRVAREHKMDPALIHAVVSAESAYNAEAVSPKGATGLMQLMPDTAKRYGIAAKDLHNPLDNLRAGARYLRDLLKMFSNDMELAVAAYNAGEGAVLKAGRKIPPYPETRKYVPKVLEFYQQYRGRPI